MRSAEQIKHLSYDEVVQWAKTRAPVKFDVKVPTWFFGGTLLMLAVWIFFVARLSSGESVQSEEEKEVSEAETPPVEIKTVAHPPEAEVN